MRRKADGETLTPEEFREALSILGWTQQHFADRVGLTPSAVNRWAQGLVVIPAWASAYLGLLVDLRELYGRYIDPSVAPDPK